MASKSKKSIGKPVSLALSVYTGSDSSIKKARITKDGDLKFLDENGVERSPAGIERSVFHDRAKGPKVRTQQKLNDGDGAIHGLEALSRYDVIFAIDTNTKEISGERVSISGFIPFSLEKEGTDYKVVLQENSVQLYDFRGVGEKPELVAIAKLVLDLKKSGASSESVKVGIVTDTELGSLRDFNNCDRPIYKDIFLPKNFSLLYASSDTGFEILNKFIRLCDREAGRTLDDLRSGQVVGGPFVHLPEFPGVTVRVGSRNAKISIDNPKISKGEDWTADRVAVYGIKRNEAGGGLEYKLKNEIFPNKS